MRRALCAVALLALACLLLRAARVGLAGDYIDPISRITAQDEALYSHSAIAMAREGDWLTPRFMGRYALYKPPLLVWTAAVSTKLLGVSRLALRLPSAIFSALALALIFLWAGELAGWQAGAVAGALVLSNHLWHTLAALCMTDGLLLACYIAAFYAFFYDPWLESRRSLFGFSAAVAGAILTKGIAGILPLGVLGLYWLAVRRKERPAFLRVCLAATLSLAFAAPWFLYQFAVHPRWFWTEHIAVEILGFGAGAPPQTSQENQALFYLMRLAVTDPLLLAAAVVAIPAFLTDLRRRGSASVLLAAWITVMVAGPARLAIPKFLVSAAPCARHGSTRGRLGPLPYTTLRRLDAGGAGRCLPDQNERARTSLGLELSCRHRAAHRADSIRLLQAGTRQPADRAGPGRRFVRFGATAGETSLRHDGAAGGNHRSLHHAVCRNGHQRDCRSVQRPCPLHPRLPCLPPGSGRSIPTTRSQR